MHTLVRTAYYTAAGGLDPDDPSLSSPEAYAERRAAWAKVVTSPERFTVAAGLDDRIVGCAAMGPAVAGHVDAAHVGQLHQIHVLTDCWGQGIGGLLHDAFIAYLRRTTTTRQRSTPASRPAVTQWLARREPLPDQIRR